MGDFADVFYSTGLLVFRLLDKLGLRISFYAMSKIQPSATQALLPKEQVFLAFEYAGHRLPIRLRWLWRNRTIFGEKLDFPHTVNSFCRLWCWDAGGALLTFSDGSQTRVEKDVLALIPSGVTFHAKYDPGTRGRTLHLNVDYASGEPVFDGLGRVLFLPFEGHQQAYIQHFDSGDHFSELITVLALLREALREVSDDLAVHAERSVNFSRLFHFVSTSPAVAAIQVDDLARLYGVTANALSKRFVRTMGYTIKDFLKRETIRRAKDKLVNSEETVDAIARSLGMENVAYFYRAFKRAVGMTPLEYRAIAGSQTLLSEDERR